MSSNVEAEGKMQFYAQNPGAVQYGNFINYYKFHPAEERIKLLPDDVWLPSPQAGTEPSSDEPFLVLDVGCNAGEVTQLLWQHLTKCTGRPVHILGVDIDAILIERSQLDNVQEQYISYACLDVMDDEQFEEIGRFLQKFKRQKFDAICCFSVTMWIHLNHHDSGLKKFLRKMSQIAEVFLVEPQPWRCYKAAEKRLKQAGKIFPLLYQLEWCKNVDQDIQQYLQDELCRHKLYESQPTKWSRKICIYR